MVLEQGIDIRLDLDRFVDVEVRGRRCLTIVPTRNRMEHHGEARRRQLRRVQVGIYGVGVATNFELAIIKLFVRELDDTLM